MPDMTTVEAIHDKIAKLPPKAQKEVLEAVERIEERYISEPVPNGKLKSEHPLSLVAALAKDVGVSDLADRHDFYVHGKLED